MFEGLFRRTPRAQRLNDCVWLSDQARLAGLQKLAGEWALARQRALVIPRVAAQLRELQIALEDRAPAVIDRFFASGLDAALEAPGALVIASEEALLPPRPVAPRAALIVIIGRDIDRRRDDALVALADCFGSEAQVAFHLSMEDAVLSGQQAALAPLLKALHVEASEALSSGMLDRSIARMQAKLHKRRQ